jgi:predicted nucleic acid-binding protein
MTGPCFVDANIFVYAINPAEALKQQVALALIERLWSEQRACTSIQAINEFYAVVTRKLRRVVTQQEAWARVEALLEWNPQSVDAAVLRRARDIELRHHLSWWDSLIVAAARLQHCALLYSEDLQHGATIDGVKIVNPFVAEVQEEPAPYTPRIAAPVSPHRPRGRPRKQAA